MFDQFPISLYLWDQWGPKEGRLDQQTGGFHNQPFCIVSNPQIRAKN